MNMRPKSFKFDIGLSPYTIEYKNPDVKPKKSTVDAKDTKNNIQTFSKELI
jgi:hypothetical protein